MKAANRPPDVIPGHVERSPTEEAEFEIVPPVPPTKLSEDEVQQLDQDCMERFIKLKVKHITDGQVMYYSFHISLDFYKQLRPHNSLIRQPFFALFSSQAW